jgi:hypothetical protein
MTQVVQHLPSSQEFLSSNICTAKKEKKKECVCMKQRLGTQKNVVILTVRVTEL